MPNVFAASTATLLLGLMPLAPSLAMSSQSMSARRLPLNYESGQVTATAEINPLTRRLLGRVLKKEVPSEVEFSATDLEGRVAMPAGKAEFLDGAIAIDAAPLRGIMAPAFERALASAKAAYNLPQGLTPAQLEAMFRYELVGEGTLSRVPEVGNSVLEGESESPQATQFVFSYDDRTGVISAQGIDPNIWQACQVETCTTALDGTFDVDLDIDGALQTSEGLDLSLPGTVKRVLRNALFWGVESLDFASGTVNSELMTQPSPEALPPESSGPELSGPESSESESSSLASPQAASSSARSPKSEAKTAVVKPPVKASSLGHASLGYREPGQNAEPAVGLITKGNFVLNARRSTVPWSAVFSIP